jgi:hypothetical protein
VHAISDSWEHCSTTGEDDVAIKITADIDIAIEDRGVTTSEVSVGFTYADFMNGAYVDSWMPINS